MVTLLPLYDGDGREVLDEYGAPVTFSESEARVLIGKTLVTVRHGRGKNAPRYLVLRVSLQEAQSKGAVKGASKVFQRIPMPEPYIIAEYIEGNRVYSHVAHRCSAAQPNMKPVSAEWM